MPMPAASAPYLPWMGRKFGVEMEMTRMTTAGRSVDSGIIERALRAAQLPLGGRVGVYYPSNGRTWDVKSDASCGWEVATSAMTMEANGECEQLRNGCNALAGLQPRIDRTCGLHVHVELHDYTWEDMQRLVSLWARYEPFFYGLMPPSRWTNSYCAPACRSLWSDTSGVRAWNHTRQAINSGNQAGFDTHARNIGRGGINLSHWWMNHRVEFRLGAGSVDYVKIRNWVHILLATVQRVKDASAPTITPVSTLLAYQFPTHYVGRVLGLAPTEAGRSVPVAHSERLLGWAEQRRSTFAAAAAGGA